jgi:uncharacterized protein YndB with AHSA1/START domain
LYAEKRGDSQEQLKARLEGKMSKGAGVASSVLGRREFSKRLAVMAPVFGIAGTALAVGGGNSEARSFAQDDISHNNDAIHQEVVFKASRKRVYEALTDAKQFEKVTLLSEAMKGGMPPDAPPTAVGREEGGAFAAFGGYITGRQIELVPNERIVQAWRVGSWKPGVYSIAKFELTDQGEATKLVFDHTGFPQGTAEHLAAGWKANYWEPLAKYLG